MRTSAFGFMLVLACLVLLPVDALAQSETGVIVNLIAVYKALGGGWEVYPPNS